MSDFLDSLVGHSLGSEPTLRPLVSSRFEPVRTAAFFPMAIDAAVDEETVTSDAMPSDTAATGTPLLNAVDLQLAEQPPIPTVAPTVRSEPWNRGPVEGDHHAVPHLESNPAVSNRSGASAPNASDGSTVDWLHRRLNDLSSQFRRFRGDFGVESSTPSIPRVDISGELLHQPPSDGPLDVAQAVNPSEPTSHQAPLRPVPELRESIESRTDFSDLPQTRDHSRSVDQFEDLLAQIRQPALQPPRVVPEDLPVLSSRVASEPTINVTIGRVEVKATRESAPAPRPARPTINPAIMSLDDYLKRRAAGGLG